MKRLAIRIIVTLLIFSTISTTDLLVPPQKAEAATPGVFWASPNTAKKLGNTFTKTKVISYNDLKKINTHFDRKVKNESVAAGIATTVITAPLSAIVSVPAGTAVSVLTTYRNNKGTIVNNTLLDSNKSDVFKVSLTYKYYRKGSRDGMYILDNISIKKVKK